MGTRQIILCGDGEPFLHPRLFDLISVAKDAGFHVMLYTNGTLLDEVRLKYLIDLRLDILKVSMYASLLEEYKNNGSSPIEWVKYYKLGKKKIKF